MAFKTSPAGGRRKRKSPGIKKIKTANVSTRKRKLSPRKPPRKKPPVKKPGGKKPNRGRTISAARNKGKQGNRSSKGKRRGRNK